MFGGNSSTSKPVFGKVYFDAMKPDCYDTIYISPHFDDAVCSCGGQIFQQTQRGEKVLVVTVAAGEPQTEIRSTFAEFQHHNWGLDAGEVVARRRAEDVAACQRLGADYLHWSLPDAIYRLHPHHEEPLYTSNESIFGVLHSAEEALEQELSLFFSHLPHSRRVAAPLSAGNHVDHQITRAAAERVWGSALLYYEDFPYVQRNPKEVARLLQPARTWRSYLVTLSHADLLARLEAMAAYRSQIGSLFNDAGSMEAAVRSHVARTGGERLWQRVGG